MLYVLLTILALALLACSLLAMEIRRRHAHLWLGSYIARSRRLRQLPPPAETHLLLCIADHYEPKWGGADADTASGRVSQWVKLYPKLFGSFKDSDGRAPRHSFFYPIEEYEPQHLDALAGLCHAGFGEVEVHLHHDNDTAENLRRTLMDFKHLLADRHALLSRRRDSGELVYGFIHGNWALDNSRPDGRWCGVNNELTILRETGCYADFTLPSAPSATQTRRINSIYHASDDPCCPKSHDDGVDAGRCPAPPDSLMLIQGPLTLDWTQRKWGIVPRIENGCIQHNQAATIARLPAWLSARVGIAARPDWVFVKLHTHGATEANQRVLLGDPMVQFHRQLARRAADDPHFHFHYVTAREMYNLAVAAASGWRGAVNDALDHELISNIGGSRDPARGALAASQAN